jgi:hypothetical protein
METNKEYAIRCSYSRCHKVIPLDLAMFETEQPDENRVLTFEPFLVRCPHCMRYQLCAVERVERFQILPPVPPVMPLDVPLS